ncbi:ABC transporter ATP-binding protein [Sulfidibacter corallicola]|uniref:ABC transporter ATP-binding protein n=1 Tax=Sulfidibacter corallicola TaxID=2818388 RepID=A0A8A4THV2_SULCO|nr:ABC transporter ATP-binding protein [Sulfidibacter corallicola]QTD48742.1 ABC transporter ATP-binding protein [Sulfidibacter corallicola]
MTEHILVARDLFKSFENPPVTVLQGISLSWSRGESIAVVGPSGCGKSTLLHLLGTLDRPDSGELSIDGCNPLDMDEVDLARFRNNLIGFVFQDHHLLPQYSVIENVLLPIMAFDRIGDEHLVRARSLLDRMGLGHRLDHRPEQLSGGERQRTALARALIKNPAVLLCDEPTGSLDGESARNAADLLLELHREEHTCLVVVTHSPDLARRMDREMTLRGGQLQEAAAAVDP